jgi:drug/metabolite transporter (DMT)-like permease
MDPRLSATFFGLASSLSWGAGDFGGGLASKRSPVYGVAIVSQLVGLVLVTALALVLSIPMPAPGSLVWGGLAGVFSAVGLVSLYRGLSTGRMGVVAPVSAVVSAAVPALYGAFLEGQPTPRQLLGFAVAFVAIWLVSRTAGGGPVRLAELGLGTLAGLGFGGFLILLDRASNVDILWSLAVVKGVSTALLLGIALLARQTRMPSTGNLPLVLLTGALDSGGNLLYALASRMGRLDIAAVLSSLYPAVTVLLARLLLKESLSRAQWVGAAAALAAVALIAA